MSYQHEIYVPKSVGRKILDDIKTLVSNLHGGCTVYEGLGVWNDVGTCADGTENAVRLHEDVWVVRVISESAEFDGLNLMEDALFSAGEKCVLATTQPITSYLGWSYKDDS